MQILPRCPFTILQTGELNEQQQEELIQKKKIWADKTELEFACLSWISLSRAKHGIPHTTKRLKLDTIISRVIPNDFGDLVNKCTRLF